MNRDIIYKELVQLDLEAESTDEVFSILAEKLEKAGYKGIYSLKLDEYDYYDEPALFDERNRNGLLEGLGR